MLDFPESGYFIKSIPPPIFILASKLLRELSLVSNFYNQSNLSLLSDLDLFRAVCLDLSSSARINRTVLPGSLESSKHLIIDGLRSLIGNVSGIYRNDFYFRFVSPNQPSTQSIVHRDVWFHSITGGWSFLPECRNIKLWIPLYYSELEYGIGVVPGSHNDYPYDFDYINTNSGPAFVPQKKLSCHDLTPLKVPIGHGLFFPPTLLHGGLEVASFSPRVSCEITLLV